MNKDVALDRNGLLCPMAKIKIAQKLKEMKTGAITSTLKS